MTTALRTLGILLITAATASAEPLLEFTVEDVKVQGKLLGKNSRQAWLLDRAGRIHEIELDAVSDFRRVSSQFRPYSHSVLRDRLLREFGREFEAATSRHYVVLGPRGTPREFAALFERTWRSFHHYFAVRGFDVPDPEFPLVAIVFPDQEAFAEFCRRESAPSRNVAGLYLTLSNWIVLYEPGSRAARQSVQDCNARQFASVQGSLEDTIIHEATHQLAFNCGLHNRLGSDPRWVVEGLATAFESEGLRDNRRGPAGDRINRRRYVDFRRYLDSGRPDGSLRSFLAGNSAYQNRVAEAYAEGWALTFFLIETRPRAYADYLKTIAARPPLLAYPPEHRVADFQDAFGQNLTLLERQFLRFMERLD